MNKGWIATLLILLCGTASADWKADLKFAQRLGGSGFYEMATKVYDDMIAAGGKSAQAGEYGKAMLVKQRAERGMARFLADLEQGRAPRENRDEIMKLFEAAEPDIRTFVDQNPGQVEARFDLAKLLVNWARFLTGANYPEEMLEKTKELAGKNRDQADALFRKAVQEFEAVAKEYSQKADEKSVLRATLAGYHAAEAVFQWALIHPPGSVKRIYNLDTAIEALDNFNAEHYEQAIGQWALLILGKCFARKGMETKNRNEDLNIALNYFENLFTDLKEDPANPDLSKLIAEGFYWYIKTSNTLASGEGLRKAKPEYWENSLRAGDLMAGKLVQGAKLRRALQARLLVAHAQAARGDIGGAIGIAGDVLKAARFERMARVAREATETLTGWLSSAGGNLTLGADLLYQIGDSLLAQKNYTDAVAAYQQAATAAQAVEDTDKWGDCWVQIANAFYKDNRNYAAAMSGMVLVDAFLKSGESEETNLGGTASDACNLARLSWKRISETSKSSGDRGEYEKIVDLFRTRFPGHRENADSAYSQARETYGRKEYAAAAEAFRAIGKTSKNYWAAQKRVPIAWYNLATARARQGDAEGQKAAVEAGLKASQELKVLAEAGGNTRQAKGALQSGMAYTALGLRKLEHWDEALKAADAYLLAYPGELKLKGEEFDIKARGHLARNELDQAEAAFKALIARAPAYKGVPALQFALYKGLRAGYKKLEEGSKERQGLASRAADLFEAYVERSDQKGANALATLGQLYLDAGKFDAAGEAYAGAADAISDPARKESWTLRAAMAQLEAAKLSPNQAERLRKLAEVAELFSKVIVKDEAKRGEVLRKLGNPNAYPSKDTFNEIKRRPETLLLAAKVFKDASPEGADGRWVAVRLVNYIHTFTKPMKDSAKPQLDRYISVWWNAAQLQLETYLLLAQEDPSGAVGRKAGQTGFRAVTILNAQYMKMDGPKRLAAFKKLAVELKRYK
ncbi:MAG: hypothetical protein O7C98_07045 [Planctomycetota bacterium]|nr:hypothetical protein [Planctomycetota bacterium]